MTYRLINVAVGMLGLLIFSCTSSSTPTQTQTNSTYDSQFREQTRSANQNYTAGGQLQEGAGGDPPITVMLLSMETGNVHPGDDYYVYAVVDNPDNRDIEYVWSVANGDVSEVPESERGRLTSIIETEYASGGAGAPIAGGETGAVGAGDGAAAGAGTGQAAPPGAAPPSGFQRPGGGGTPSGGFSTGGPTSGSPSGGQSGDIPPGGSLDENGQPQGRLEVPANPGTGGSPDASLAPGAGLDAGGAVKGGAEDEEESTTKSEDEKVDDGSAEPGPDEEPEEPGNEDPDPGQDEESAFVFEHRQVAGPAAAQADEDPASDTDESDDSEDATAESDEEELERVDATGAASIAERISEGASSAGTMADDAVLAGEPEDFSSLSTQYERWKEGTGEFRRQPLGPYGDDAEVESLESEESYEGYTFVTDEPFILWTPRMPGETTIYLKLTYKEEDLTEPTGLDVTIRLKDPSVELADDFPEIVREDEFVFIRLDGENIPSFNKGLFTLEYDFNKLSFREAELGGFFDDSPDASLYYAQPDKNAGKVLLAIDTNTELVNLSGDGELVYVKFEAKQDIGDMTETNLMLLSNASASYILDRNGENVLPEPIEYPIFRTQVTSPPALGSFTRENTPGTPQPGVAGAGTGAPAAAAGGAARTSGGGTPAAAGGGTPAAGGGRTIGTPENPTSSGQPTGGGIPLGPLAGGVPPGEGAVAGGVSGGLVPNEDRVAQDAEGGSAAESESEQAEPEDIDPLAMITERNIQLTNAIRDADMDSLTQALDAGADPGWLDPLTGMSALHLAVLEDNAQAVQLMIDYRADPNVRSEEGYSAFDYAEAAGLDEVLSILMSSPAGRR